MVKEILLEINFIEEMRTTWSNKISDKRSKKDDFENSWRMSLIAFLQSFFSDVVKVQYVGLPMARSQTD